MAECLKAAEEVSQEDACPIVGREQLRPILLALRERTPELRARQTQTGTAVFTEKLENITEEDADFLIANGTIAHVARSFSEKAARPGEIKEIIEVDSARAKDRGSAEFSAIKKKIYRYFFEEEKELDMEYYI